MAVLCVTHLCNGMCVSLQAPFYPAEAEKKGASATEYGLVFGIFELTVFIVSPFVGKILPRVRIYNVLYIYQHSTTYKDSFFDR